MSRTQLNEERTLPQLGFISMHFSETAASSFFQPQ